MYRLQARLANFYQAGLIPTCRCTEDNGLMTWGDRHPSRPPLGLYHLYIYKYEATSVVLLMLCNKRNHLRIIYFTHMPLRLESNQRLLQCC